MGPINFRAIDCYATRSKTSPIIQEKHDAPRVHHAGSLRGSFWLHAAHYDRRCEARRIRGKTRALFGQWDLSPTSRRGRRYSRARAVPTAHPNRPRTGGDFIAAAVGGPSKGAAGPSRSSARGHHHVVEVYPCALRSARRDLPSPFEELII
jgi:hypothetical protein